MCSAFMHVQPKSVAGLIPCGANFQSMGDKKMMYLPLSIPGHMVLKWLADDLGESTTDQP